MGRGDRGRRGGKARPRHGRLLARGRRGEKGIGGPAGNGFFIERHALLGARRYQLGAVQANAAIVIFYEDWRRMRLWVVVMPSIVSIRWWRVEGRCPPHLVDEDDEPGGEGEMQGW